MELTKQFRIGIIDSGRGGDYIAKHISKVFINAKFFQYRPYQFRAFGSMGMRDLQYQMDTQMDFLRGNNLDFVVIGCMTASVRMFSYICECLPYPVFNVYGTLPPLSEDTVVVCTPNSVPGFAHQNVVPCAELAGMIEKNYPEPVIPTSIMESTIREYLYGVPFEVKGKNLLLGCTHYYAVMEILRKVTECDKIIFPHTGLVDKLIKTYA